MAELKPCPFCGGKAALCTKQYDGRIYRYRIQCDNAGCACRTPWLCYQEDAVEVWNRRAENEGDDISPYCENCPAHIDAADDVLQQLIKEREKNASKI